MLMVRSWIGTICATVIVENVHQSHFDESVRRSQFLRVVDSLRFFKRLVGGRRSVFQPL